jgi:hypothetical protein
MYADSARTPGSADVIIPMADDEIALNRLSVVAANWP